MTWFLKNGATPDNRTEAEKAQQISERAEDYLVLIRARAHFADMISTNDVETIHQAHKSMDRASKHYYEKWGY